MNKNGVLAIALLAGTIVGAGIFSLPYVVNSIGLINGVFYLLFFTAVYYTLHRMYAELLLNADAQHQFAFTAHRYLPRWLARIVSSAILLELIFVMVVYLILAPAFLTLIAGINPLWLGGVFWVAGSLFLFARLAWIEWAEFAGTISMIGIVGIVLAAGWGRPIATPAFAISNWLIALMPFGPVLFALSGRPAIGAVVEAWRKSRREGHSFSLPRVILIGTLVPACLYILFTLGALMLHFPPTPDTVSGLGGFSPFFLALLGALGFVALWTSYFMVGINLRDTLQDDLKVSRFFAYAAPLLLPPLLYVLGLNNFLGAVSFTGSVFLGVEGISIVLMWRRAFPTHPRRWTAYPLITIFALAIVAEIIKLF